MSILTRNRSKPESSEALGDNIASVRARLAEFDSELQALGAEHAEARIAARDLAFQQEILGQPAPGRDAAEARERDLRQRLEARQEVAAKAREYLAELERPLHEARLRELREMFTETHAGLREKADGIWAARRTMLTAHAEFVTAHAAARQLFAEIRNLAARLGEEEGPGPIAAPPWGPSVSRLPFDSVNLPPREYEIAASQLALTEANWRRLSRAGREDPS